MLTQTDYEKISLLKSENKEVYQLFTHMEDYYLQILSHTCHDITNSSGLIHSYLELMEQQTPSLLSNPFWSKLKKNSELNLKLLQELAKFRYAHSPKKYQEFSLESLVQNLKELFPDILLPEAPSDATIYGSYSNILASLEALIHNAVEASTTNPDARISLSIQESDSHVQFTITDDGCGFSTSALENAFQPFFSEKTGHTGIGLSTAFRTAYQHHGTLYIKNEKHPTQIVFSVSRCNISEPE